MLDVKICVFHQVQSHYFKLYLFSFLYTAPGMVMLVGQLVCLFGPDWSISTVFLNSIFAFVSPFCAVEGLWSLEVVKYKNKHTPSIWFITKNV